MLLLSLNSTFKMLWKAHVIEKTMENIKNNIGAFTISQFTLCDWFLFMKYQFIESFYKFCSVLDVW